MILKKELIISCDELFDSELGKRVYSDILKTVTDFGMLELFAKGTIVGLSGGADSVLLTIFLWKLRKEYNFKLKTVHINHMIRGCDADRDEEFSRNFSNLLGIDFISYKYDVPSLAKESKRGLEETARIVRYKAFDESLSSEYRTVATAHNATDNTETFIFNFMRGSGTLGLTGISPVRDNIVRPLIAVSKENVVRILSEKCIPYCTDDTNFSVEYSRNYIRHEILPKLGRLASDPDLSAARAIENIRCDSDFIEKYAAEFYDANCIDSKIKVGALMSLHKAPFVRVIKRMVSEISTVIPEKIHFDEIYNALKKQKSFEIDLPGGIAFYSRDGYCFISKKTDIVKKNEILIKLCDGITEIPELGIAIVISDSKCEDFSSNVYKFSIQANLFSAIIVGEMYLRTKQDGDSYFYGGMTRKVKKLFNDKKLTSEERNSIPVICDDRGILWIPGFGVRDDQPLEKKSKWITVYKKIN